MTNTTPAKAPRSAFPPLYWLVVVFEFFERGSYYGVMSVLSVYLTDVLHFPKQDVGVIKGTIQPLLYFLPIVAGALADRFGYRRALLFAFGLLGTGYFLASQSTEYATVFLSLVVMGIGAGTFKPIISGTIARCTDESNSTLGFGIFYWSINLGAFVAPLVLVPLLKKSLGWPWVLGAAAIGTGAMILPTLLLYREPPAPHASGEGSGSAPAVNRPPLLQTLANAFEIVYSPVVLLADWARRARTGAIGFALLVGTLLAWGSWDFIGGSEGTVAVSAARFPMSSGRLTIVVARDLTADPEYEVEPSEGSADALVTLHDPDRLADSAPAILAKLRWARPDWELDAEALRRLVAEAGRRHKLVVRVDGSLPTSHQLRSDGPDTHLLLVKSRDEYRRERAAVMATLDESPVLCALSGTRLDDAVAAASARPFFVLFVGLLLGAAALAVRLARRAHARAAGAPRRLALGTLGLLGAIIWSLQLWGGLSLFAAILSTVISTTVLSLYAIDTSETARFRDHFRFVSMIFIYSGFWILYFQMFDSVLWYVQAYVDASSLDAAVNRALAVVGIQASWRFDVEHVTVINAATIIALQLVVSALVKNTRALPTMVVGIGLATVGMAILAISTSIWVFMLGIFIFSLGEMTAHPKFISYVGQSAPKARVAMYMGYLFLYGVVGSSIGSVVGAKLYVRFVDELSRPRTLWLIFASIGLATVLGLLAFDRLTRTPAATAPSPAGDGAG